jgi:lipopolysaccharide export system permease protein
VAIFFLTTLRLLFAFLDDLPNVGKGDYDMALAMIALTATFPSILYDFLPIGMLVGVMFGLGNLASHSELIVVRCAGVSPSSLMISAGKHLAPWIVGFMLVGEFVGPPAAQWAENLRSQAVSSGQIVAGKHGTWARDGRTFVHIRRILPNATLQDVSLFQFASDEWRLTGLVRAKRAVYEGREQWLMTDVVVSDLSGDVVSRTSVPQLAWPSTLTPANLGSADLEPSAMNILELYEFADFLDKNQLDSSRFALAFWRKAAKPVSLVVMLMLAGALVFGSVRYVSLGVRLLVGILLGMAYWALNDIFGPLAIVYGMPPWLGAWLPLLIFMGIAYWRLNRVL